MYLVLYSHHIPFINEFSLPVKPCTNSTVLSVSYLHSEPPVRCSKVSGFVYHFPDFTFFSLRFIHAGNMCHYSLFIADCQQCINYKTCTRTWLGHVPVVLCVASTLGCYDLCCYKYSCSSIHLSLFPIWSCDNYFWITFWETTLWMFKGTNLPYSPTLPLFTHSHSHGHKVISCSFDWHLANTLNIFPVCVRHCVYSLEISLLKPFAHKVYWKGQCREKWR